jgi:hypothetical protein
VEKPTPDNKARARVTIMRITTGTGSPPNVARTEGPRVGRWSDAGLARRVAAYKDATGPHTTINGAVQAIWRNNRARTTRRLVEAMAGSLGIQKTKRGKPRKSRVI